MNQMTEETVWAKIQRERQTPENSLSNETVNAFIEDLELALLDSEDTNEVVILARSLPEWQNTQMVELLEAMSSSDEPAVQLEAISLHYNALANAVEKGEMEPHLLDRMRNGLIELMTSYHADVRGEALRTFKERTGYLQERDITSLGWLAVHTVEVKEVHGDSYYIRLRQEELLEKQKKEREQALLAAYCPWA